MRKSPASWCHVGCSLLGRVALFAVLLAGPALLAGADGAGPWRVALEGPTRAGSPGPTAPETGSPGAADAKHAGTLPRLVTLREGAAAGLVHAGGFQPSSYKAVHLRVRNISSEPLRVDVCGSHLEPRKRGSCQRLGLGPVVTPRKGKRKRRGKTAPHPRPPDQPPGTVVIRLKAGEEKTVHLQTCCLDAGKPAPSRQSFEVASKALPAVREESLRWWADNPEAPQSMVNRAIWQFRPVEGDGYDFMQGGSRRPPRGGNGIASHAGTVYLLRAGELLARDPDGIERFLGTEMEEVHPTDSAVYAVSWGAPAGRGVTMSPAPRELWRLVYTGDTPWAHIATLPPKLQIDEVKIAPSGAILLLTGQGLYRVDRARKTARSVLLTEDADNLSLAFTRKGRAQVTRRRPGNAGYVQGGERKGQSMPVCELWEVDPATGEKTRLREFWNVKQIRTGRAGLFALTHGGKLRRLMGRSFRNAPGQMAYDRIVHVGRKHAWLEDKAGRLVAVDKAGRIRFRAGPHMPARGSWAVDAHDDAVVWRTARDTWRMDAPRGKRLKLPIGPQDDR